jgi:nucleotide-binding universal stress UspA family protein
MTYKTILIKADHEARFHQTAATALAIASRFHSHLICLAPPPQLAPRASDSDRASPRLAPREAERMRALLARATQPSNTTWEWIGAGEQHSATAFARAHAADLIVVSAAETTHGQASPSVGDLILASGRPVMQVPRAGGPFAPGGTVLIAWNGSREAAWATFSAMPLLKLARSVKLLYVASEVEEDFRDTLIRESRQEMSRALARHGVRAAEEEIGLTIPEIGAALVSAAKAESADLIVMGGSGHTRSGDLVLGRTTRHMLASSGVPLLLSH